MFEVDLKNQVPSSSSYGPQNPDWGGPACCQMAMNGYPPGATSCYIGQTTIWNYIQANNKEGGTGPWGIGWYSDPYAVTKALNDLCPPQHQWVDVSDTNKETVLYKLFRWMANYEYASLVCVFAHDYWSTLVYYKTSDDPREANNPTLDRIGWYEPYYTSFGPQVDYKEVDGSVWMTSPYYWGAPCGGFTNPLCGQIWKNKYVGIGEPPEAEGSVQVEKISRVGKELISPRDAAAIARRFLVERRRQESGFILQRMTDVRSARPMLVRELLPEQVKQATEEGVRYYLVPFRQRYEVDETGAPLARLSVLVNAYTGRFEELCVFPQPLRYLSERDALRIASRNLRLSRREVDGIEAELVFQPLRPYVSSALPAWRVTAQDKVFYVSQTGLVLGTLFYPTYRGA